MSKEIIEFLKSNRVPYYLWTPEEREVADRIPRRWWLCSISNLPDFDPVSTRLEEELGAGGGADGTIYRLKPDYEPEPESGWVEYDVSKSGSYFEFCRPIGMGQFDCFRINELPGMVGFGGIMYEDCECGSMADAGMTGKFHMTPPEPCEKHGPHKPIKVRFWRQKE